MGVKLVYEERHHKPWLLFIPSCFKAYRRCRDMKLIEAVKEILKNNLIFTALLAIIKERTSLKKASEGQA
jgi:hypothetical protein